MAVFWIKLCTYIKKLIFFDKKLYRRIFFRNCFFGSNYAKPDDFEASIILENDFVVVKKQHQTEDDFEFLSAIDSN